MEVYVYEVLGVCGWKGDKVLQYVRLRWKSGMFMNDSSTLDSFKAVRVRGQLFWQGDV